MGLNTLLIDVGNTRVKWRMLSGGEATEGAAEHQANLDQIVASLPEGPVSQIRFAQVLGGTVADALTAALGARYRCPAQQATVRAQAFGLNVGYTQPERLGVDRWLAMLAARQHAAGRPIVIAMAGTALTLDVVDATGRHLGGLIAPGLSSARSATLNTTRFEYHGEPTAAPGQLGLNTEACVALGARSACLGALDRGAAYAPDNSVRYLGGGDAPALLPELPGWQWIEQPVLDGLQVWSAAMVNPSATD